MHPTKFSFGKVQCTIYWIFKFLYILLHYQGDLIREQLYLVCKIPFVSHFQKDKLQLPKKVLFQILLFLLWP